MLPFGVCEIMEKPKPASSMRLDPAAFPFWLLSHCAQTLQPVLGDPKPAPGRRLLLLSGFQVLFECEVSLLCLAPSRRGCPVGRLWSLRRSPAGVGSSLGVDLDCVIPEPAFLPNLSPIIWLR